MFHKIVSIVLAFLVLFSTVSFTIEKHFCGDVLIAVSLFAEVQKCTMESFEIEQATIKNKSCCKDTVDIIQGQNELIVNTVDDLELDKQFFITSFVYAYLKLLEGFPKNKIPYKNYSPPNLILDIQVLDQVFII